MSKLRKVVDERDARACLSAVARSGKTRREWARKHQVDGRSLRAWELNLSRTGSTGALAPRVQPRLVEIVPTPMAASTRRYLVRVGDVAVEVGDNFDDATLRRLLEALRAC